MRQHRKRQFECIRGARPSGFHRHARRAHGLGLDPGVEAEDAVRRHLDRPLGSPTKGEVRRPGLQADFLLLLRVVMDHGRDRHLVPHHHEAGHRKPHQEVLGGQELLARGPHLGLRIHGPGRHHPGGEVIRQGERQSGRAAGARRHVGEPGRRVLEVLADARLLGVLAGTARVILDERVAGRDPVPARAVEDRPDIRRLVRSQRVDGLVHHADGDLCRDGLALRRPGGNRYARLFAGQVTLLAGRDPHVEEAIRRRDVERALRQVERLAVHHRGHHEDVGFKVLRHRDLHDPGSLTGPQHLGTIQSLSLDGNERADFGVRKLHEHLGDLARDVALLIEGQLHHAVSLRAASPFLVGHPEPGRFRDLTAALVPGLGSQAVLAGLLRNREAQRRIALGTRAGGPGSSGMELGLVLGHVVDLARDRLDAKQLDRHVGLNGLAVVVLRPNFEVARGTGRVDIAIRRGIQGEGAPGDQESALALYHLTAGVHSLQLHDVALVGGVPLGIRHDLGGNLQRDVARLVGLGLALHDHVAVAPGVIVEPAEVREEGVLLRDPRRVGARVDGVVDVGPADGRPEVVVRRDHGLGGLPRDVALLGSRYFELELGLAVLLNLEHRLVAVACDQRHQAIVTQRRLRGQRELAVEGAHGVRAGVELVNDVLLGIDHLNGYRKVGPVHDLAELVLTDDPLVEDLLLRAIDGAIGVREHPELLVARPVVGLGMRRRVAELADQQQRVLALVITADQAVSVGGRGPAQALIVEGSDLNAGKRLLGEEVHGVDQGLVTRTLGHHAEVRHLEPVGIRGDMGHTGATQVARAVHLQHISAWR
ncbi:hypothetical protein D3C87_963170 [compost metagenome]